MDNRPVQDGPAVDLRRRLLRSAAARLTGAPLWLIPIVMLTRSNGYSLLLGVFLGAIGGLCSAVIYPVANGVPIPIARRSAGRGSHQLEAEVLRLRQPIFMVAANVPFIGAIALILVVHLSSLVRPDGFVFALAGLMGVGHTWQVATGVQDLQVAARMWMQMQRQSRG